ncbi:MAG: type IV toxin-antitoxin system AbiEi family antitoxin domain-containing protein, partial [Bacteroidales bacterium]
NLRPKILQELLENCNSIKVIRLFLYMASKANHQWLDFVDQSRIDLGTGDRVIVKGGVYIKKYKISLPKELTEK